MLFILFVNDIFNITVNGDFSKFYADDFKMYTTLISTDDSHNFQDALSNLLLWSTAWQLKFYVSKCHVLHLHKNNIHGLTHELLFWWKSHWAVLYLVNNIGGDIDSLLNFHKHACIDRTAPKAYSRIGLGLLFRGFVSRNVHVFRQAYNTYIRPLLENASNVWSLHLITHINSLKRVQRHFTKRIISGKICPVFKKVLLRLNYKL